MQETTPQVKAIDSHAHVFLKDLPWTEGRRYAPSYDAPLSHYLSLLASHGMSHGVLIQPSFLGTDNSYLIACLEQHPALLRGVVVIDPQRDAPLMDAYDTKGVVGIRANLIGQPAPDFANPAWQRILTRMRALDWHLEVQIEARRLAEISGTILASGVRLVVDHFGRLDPTLGATDPAFEHLLSLGKTAQVWVKVSGTYRISPQIKDADAHVARTAATENARMAYGRLKDGFGTERLVWGSDWPHTSYEGVESFDSAFATFLAVVTDPADRHALLSATPKALFRF